MKALEVDNLSVSYDHSAQKQVDNISFSIDKGQLTMLIGPNGSGKTTLIKAILGLIPHTGKVKIFGRNVQSSYFDIGYVPQGFSFDRSLPITVSEVMLMPLAACHKGCQHGQNHLIHTLRLVDSADLLNQPLRNLSGGQVQKILLARSLIHSPKLLLLDEPEAGVDIEAEQSLYGLLINLTQKGITTLIASHEVELVLEYADQVLCVNRQLICKGPPQDTLTTKTFQKMYGKHISLYQPNHYEHHS